METHLNTDTTKTLRKNFTMSVSTANELEFLAKFSGEKQSRIIQQLIHKEFENYKNNQRLEKLKKLKGLFTGQLKDQSIQRIKAERKL